MGAVRNVTAPVSPNNRSSVGNQSRLFTESLDLRTTSGRRYRDLIAEFTSDLGGPDRISEAQRAIIRRASSLCVWCEAIEFQLAQGDTDINIGPYATACNSLRRLLLDLGLERRMQDITPTLHQYLGAKA